ncbi:tRNA (5-methylaminomethyl-2-thiouridine)(34)-methyltransferase MnmD [Flavobacterium litorale]|uniref:tRNA (5-methylaminomethyl-2-thiouridine)(34)-methyltransferase MnmD n=1 Tax=Flavobacterium litorale TaxID=2856519 RepID=A0ABX8VBD3_9FLAO|nr:tRNA (5-methylaminomethyl-2-thiouridine)(34)-methyltransferase MnmD [Flavobacterium litorale]QYJ68125.1 tRNA (5-methylaminomethyl-2-thiouridine)(34)-methyltransferase MnmD [Flavobacterium litorale]
MKREIITTSDGSVTIYLPEIKETYHSRFGAIQEAYHVFIKNGLALTESEPVAILEIGFGTGLNAFITYLESKKNNQQIKYTGIEAYPIPKNEILQLNYITELNAEHERAAFEQLHNCKWEQEVNVSAIFTLCKQQQRFEDVVSVNSYDLIYFDAFGYHAQPELWSTAIFKKMFTALKSGGILVTYACRTSIKKAMEEAGFTTEKLPGPPGKREMLRAVKL